MRRCLVEKLACPQCRGDIEIFDVQEDNDIRILQGTLRCASCGQKYPIEKGVPRLVKVAADQAEVCKRFSFQWLSRWQGKFEGERCYGFNDDIYVGWVKEQLECRKPFAPGDWLLDAGCGSGEKTQVLAKQSPEQNVVGLDMGVASQEKAMAKFGHMTNLDYVQGNIMEPPFKDRQFDAGMSLGVLHHTRNTREAVAKFRRMLKEETTCCIWIYPTYWEGPEWRLVYFARDVLCFGQSHRLPTGFLRLFARTLVTIGWPIVQLGFWMSYRRIGRDLPFFRIKSMTWKERFDATFFFCFDTLLPRYQGRHKIKEVESWLVEEGLEPIRNLHSFYIGSNVPVQTRTEKAPAEQILAGAAT
jgi:uncharacterized protein YbaR (Trm112 family)